MAEVAQKLEKLEVMMSNVREDDLSQLSTEAVHYNPSELDTWLDSMLSDLNPPSSADDYDLKAIPGDAILNQYATDSSSSSNQSRDMNTNKRLKSMVHVIDFSMNHGLQWPTLKQALTFRPGGPPIFRLTGIGPPTPDNLANLDPSMMELRPSEIESVAVNSVFELHKFLERPGGKIESGRHISTCDEEDFNGV